MAENLVKFQQGLLKNLSKQAVSNGTLWFTTDEGAIYLDTEGKRVRFGDYVTVDGSTVKIKDVADSAPTASTTGFIGQVVEIEDHGFAYCTGTAGNVGKTGKRVVIEVIKNETV